MDVVPKLKISIAPSHGPKGRVNVMQIENRHKGEIILIVK